MFAEVKQIRAARPAGTRTLDSGTARAAQELRQGTQSRPPLEESPVMSSPFGSIFNNIKNAKSMAGYAPRLSNGSHTVIVKKYKTKNSEQGMGTILESEFLIARSTDQGLREGDTRSWPWFIEGKGWSATYAQDNAKQFIDAVMRSVDLSELPTDVQGHVLNPVNGQPFPELDDRGMPIIDPGTRQVKFKKEHDQSSIGELLAFGVFRGVQVAAEVTPAIDKKTGVQRVDSKQKPVFNATWKPVPGQNMAGIAQVRAYLDTIDPPDVAPATPATAPAPAAQAAHVAPVQLGGAVQTQWPSPAPAAQPTAQPAPAPAAPVVQPAAPGGLTNILAGLRK